LENQHRQIKGYRDLTAEEIALMNEVKAKAGEVGVLVGKVAATAGVDGRWASIGKTDLQTGFMALIRAIAQPTTF
jgi:molybdate-binding protein